MKENVYIIKIQIINTYRIYRNFLSPSQSDNKYSPDSLCIAMYWGVYLHNVKSNISKQQSTYIKVKSISLHTLYFDFVCNNVHTTEANLYFYIA